MDRLVGTVPVMLRFQTTVEQKLCVRVCRCVCVCVREREREREREKEREGGTEREREVSLQSVIEEWNLPHMLARPVFSSSALELKHTTTLSQEKRPQTKLVLSD